MRLLCIYLPGQETADTGIQRAAQSSGGQPQKVGGVKKWENYLTYRHHLT